MTDLSLDLIGSANDIVIDGGLVKTGLYASVLAALRPGQTVHTSANPEGSAFGAAALVFNGEGQTPFVNDCAIASPIVMPGLDDYRSTWRSLIAEPRSAKKEARA